MTTGMFWAIKPAAMPAPMIPVPITATDFIYSNLSDEVINLLRLILINKRLRLSFFMV
jgi:hypothetical protein